MIKIFVAFWVLAFMIFKVNLLNDPSDPSSRMSSYHLENLAVLERVRTEMKGDIVIEWTTIWPYLCPTLTSATCTTLLVCLRTLVE